MLESTVTYPPGSDIVTPQDPHGTSTVVDTTVYLGVSWASTIPADPYGSSRALRRSGELARPGTNVSPRSARPTRSTARAVATSR